MELAKITSKGQITNANDGHLTENLLVVGSFAGGIVLSSETEIALVSGREIKWFDLPDESYRLLWCGWGQTRDGSRWPVLRDFHTLVQHQQQGDAVYIGDRFFEKDGNYNLLLNVDTEPDVLGRGYQLWSLDLTTGEFWEVSSTSVIVCHNNRLSVEDGAISFRAGMVWFTECDDIATGIKGISLPIERLRSN